MLKAQLIGAIVLHLNSVTNIAITLTWFLPDGVLEKSVVSSQFGRLYNDNDRKFMCSWLYRVALTMDGSMVQLLTLGQKEIAISRGV